MIRKYIIIKICWRENLHQRDLFSLYLLKQALITLSLMEETNNHTRALDGREI